MQFNFLGDTINVSNDMINYAEIRHFCEEEATNGRQKFETLYFEENKTIESVIYNSADQAGSIWIETLNKLIKYLISQDIYEFDEESFFNTYFKRLFSDFLNSLNDIEFAYKKILNEEGIEKYNRELRKASRTKFRGYGASMTGAIGASAKAGILNATTGLGHSLLNSIGGAMSASKTNSSKKKLFNNPEVKESLSNGLYLAIFNMHLCIVEIINNYSSDGLNFSIDNETSKKNDIILKNILNHNFQENKLIEILKKCILTNPFDSKYYHIAIELFNDPENEISELSKIFHIDTLDYKKSLIKQYYEELDTSDENTTNNSKLLLENKLNSLGFKSDSYGKIYQYKELVSKLKQFDLDYRTVDGICFDTRNDADLASQDFEFILSILENIDPDSKDDLSKCIDSIQENCKTKLGKKYIDILSENLKTILLKERTLDLELGENIYSIVYETKDFADLGRKRVAKLENLIESTNLSDEVSLNNTLKSIFNMSEDKDDLVYEYFSEYIKSILSNLDLNLRTVNGKIYKTREEAYLVKDGFNKIKNKDISEELSEKDLNIISSSVESDEFHEDVKDAIKDKVFNAKLKKEDLREEKFNSRVGFIFIVIAAISYLFSYSTSSSFSAPDLLNTGVLLEDLIVVDQLSLADGVKNGLMVFPRTIAESTVIAFKDYLSGFEGGLTSNIIWFIGGMIWIPMKSILLFIPRFFLVLFAIFAQEGHPLYYIGYIASLLLTFKIVNLSEFKKKDIKREDV